MPQLLRRALGVSFLLAIVACAGGGGGCGGCTPIAGGFPQGAVIANGATVRITRPGLDFIGEHSPAVVSGILELPGGQFDVAIPTAQAKFGPFDAITVNLCPDGPKPEENPPKCLAEVAIGRTKLRVDAVAPDVVRLNGTLPVRLQNLPGTISVIGGFQAGLGAGRCDGDTPSFDFKDFPVRIEVPFSNETRPPRRGYTKLDLENAVIEPAIASGDVSICKGCSFATDVCNAILNWIKDLAFNAILDGIKGQVKTALANALCTKPTPWVRPPCPDGAGIRDGNCVYPDGSCIPLALGTEGRMDLSEALASVSPGSKGAFDFVLAAGNGIDMAPFAPPDASGHTPNGLTLTMLGGALPSPQSDCVPPFDNPIPRSIPVPDELRRDVQTPWPDGEPAPHVGIALSGRFLDYAFGSAYNSGLLCLGISTEQVQMIQSGLVSVLIPSIKRLTFEQRSAPVAIATRPQKPPSLTLGSGDDPKNDPLLALHVPELSIDFYVWSLDRYVRAFTFTGDFTIPVNLQTGKSDANPAGGLLPVLGELTIARPVVTNHELLSDDPKAVAGALASILGGLSGQLTGAIGPIDVGALLGRFGLGVSIPDGAIRRLSKGGDDYLAIFGTFSRADATRATASPRARIVDKVVHPEAMGLATLAREKLPELHVALSSSLDDGARAVEYSWGLDRGTRSAWSTERDVTIKDDYLAFQGKHELKVWSRLRGAPETESPTPAVVPYVIDTLPPRIEATADARGDLTVAAWDFVSPDAALSMRYRVTRADGTEEPFTAWAPLEAGKVVLTASALGDGATEVRVEVRDEEGNVGEENALIRGKPDASLRGAGCSCDVPGPAGGSGAGAWAVVAFAGLFGIAWRRRKAGRASAASVGTLALVASVNQGCGCGSESGEDLQKKFGCGAECNEACLPPLPVGEVGAYTSSAQAKDGTLWFAGYSDGFLSRENDYAYGDLVVGAWDPERQRIAWEAVDGVPARTDGSCPPADRSGWRNGETLPGDNVGLWTSIRLGKDGRPLVSYYDATHRALKFAAFDGTRWWVHEVFAPADAKGDAGRYAKMVLLEDKPVIAFSVNQPGIEGYMRSKIVLAKADGPSPRAPSDWTFEDVNVDERAPCRAWVCNAGEVCASDTGRCAAPVTGCEPACGGGQACLDGEGGPACRPTLAESLVEAYPSAIGNYLSLALGPDGLGLVAYDRIRGNLVAMKREGGAWSTHIVDGETGVRPSARDTGDVGIGASLYIAPDGAWHVAYVDGIEETLIYRRLPDGRPGGERERVDDGFRMGANAPVFTDGRHIVGDDSFVHADDAGNVTIAYQDATKGELRVARGVPETKGHTWTLSAVSQPERFAGFFPNLIPSSGAIANYWRRVDPETKGLVGDVAVVTP